ncbi:MAG: hypothetical protein ACRC6X_00210 [Culicoidibacterales bacterium]
MIIKFSEKLGDIELSQNKYNSLHFQNQTDSEIFTAVLRKYLHIKQEILTDIELVIEDVLQQKIKQQEIILIEVECTGELQQKSIQKQILQQVISKIELDEGLFKEVEAIKTKYYGIAEQLEQTIEITDYDLHIDMSKIETEKILEFLNLKFKFSGEIFSENNFIKKKNIIEFCLAINQNKLIVLLFPEVSLVRELKVAFVDFLKELGITVLVVTNDQSFLLEGAISGEIVVYDRLSEKMPVLGIIDILESFSSEKAVVKQKVTAFLLGEVMALNPYEIRSFEQLVLEKKE